MSTKIHRSIRLRLFILLIVVSGTFGVVPASASTETNKIDLSTGFLNADGTLKLDGNAPAAFSADNWNVQLNKSR